MTLKGTSTASPAHRKHAVVPDAAEEFVFKPKFQIPDNSPLHRPNPPKTSLSDHDPIQIAISIPAERLGHDAADGMLTFDFTVEQRRITVDPIRCYDAGKNKINWYNILTDQERLAVFNYILAEYRTRAHGNDGFRVAALGITHDNEMFIASNTRPKNQLYKKCAETAVIAAAQEFAMQSKSAAYGQRLKTDNPQTMFKDFLVMGGKDESTINIACPCGSCTDELDDHMTIKGQDKKSHLQQQGHIIVLRAPDETQKNADGLIAITTPRINKVARSLADLHPNDCWSVAPAKLYRMGVVALSREGAHIQKTSMTKAMEQVLTPSQKAMEDYKLRQVHALAALADTNSTVRGELQPDFSLLNRLMQESIDEAFIHRMHNLRAGGQVVTDENLQKFIHTIRCSVIQLEDGTYSMGIEVRGQEPARQSAEQHAIGEAVHKIKGVKVTHIWSMEMKPKAIKTGEMPLPFKDNLERVAKSSKDPMTLQVTAIPYNDNSEKGVNTAMRYQKTFALPAIYPNLYTGNHQSSTIFAALDQARARLDARHR